MQIGTASRYGQAPPPDPSSGRLAWEYGSHDRCCLRPGAIAAGDGWSFELKYDRFRAIVSTEEGHRVRSRRGRNTADRVRGLAVIMAWGW